MTKLVRWNPYRSSIFNEVDRLFENSASNTNTHWNVAIDVLENEDVYTIKASVPGLAADDLDLTLEDNVLTIKGEIQAEESEENEQFHIRERRYGRFSRSVRFPVNVDADNVEATYENGILTLSVPKAEEVKPRKIAVKAS